VPVGTPAVGPPGASIAGLLAVAILSLSGPELREEWRRECRPALPRLPIPTFLRALMSLASVLFSAGRGAAA